MTPPANPTDPSGPDDPIGAAITGWRREAADLGGRNPLLWYRDLQRGTFDLTVAHPGGVAKLLAGAPTLLSDLVREQVAFAEAGQKIRAIRDKATQIERDHGMSTAFITIGMASWTIRRAPTPPRAPVLLRPCRIVATDAGYTDFRLSADPYLVVNPVLAHYLTTELGRRVDTDRLIALATHAHGFDPRPAYEELESICAGLDGFGIGPQMVVSTFPWAKLPFVAAMSGSEAEQRIAKAPLTRLLAQPATPAGADGADPTDPDPDLTAQAEELTAGDLEAGDTVLDTDRDQRAVIAAVRDGHSIVVDGPGGSGRTQTIANLVADRIAAGQRVLVISEFTPALQDLTHRLDDAGMTDRAFWIKDNPRDLAAMVQSLRSSLEDRAGAAKRSPRGATGKAVARSENATAIATREARDRIAAATRLLGEHQGAMHGPHQPWGATLIQAQETLARLAARSRPPVSHVRLTGAPLRDLLPGDLADLCSQLATAAATGAWQRGRGDDPWYGASLADEAETVRAGEIVSRLVGGELDRARTLALEVCSAAGLPEPVTLEQWRQYLDLLGDAHRTLDTFRSAIYEAPLRELAAAYDPEATPRPSAMARARAKRQVRSLLRPGMPPKDLGARVRAARAEWERWEELAGRAARPTAVAGWEESVDAFDPLESDLTWLAGVLEGTSIVEDLTTLHLDTVLERLLRLDARPDRLAHAARSYALLQPLREAGLGPLVDDLAARGVQEDQVGAEVEFVYWSSLLDQFTATRPPGDGAEIRSALAQIADAEDELASARREEVVAATAEPVPAALRRFAPQASYLRDTDPGHDVPGWVGSIAGLAQVLRPCWLVSPIVLPALVPDRVQFDLVIIDEATRIPVAHAVTALSKATQVVAFGSALDPAPRTFTAAGDPRAAAPAAGNERESVWQALARRRPVLRLGGDYRSIDARLRQPLQRAGIQAGRGFPGVLRSPRYASVWADPDELIDTVIDRVLDHARHAAWQSLAVLCPDPAVVARLDHRLRERIAAEGMARAFRDDAAESLLLCTVDEAAGLVRDRVFLVVENHRELDRATVARAVIGARRSVVALIGGAGSQPLPPGDGADVLADAFQFAGAAPGATDLGVAAGHGSQLLDDLMARLRSEMLSVGGPFGEGSHRVDLTIDDPDLPDRPLLAVRTDLRAWNQRMLEDATPAAAAAEEAGSPGEGNAEAADTVDRDQVHIIPRHLARLGWVTEEVWCNDLFRDPAREVARLVQAAWDASRARSGSDG